MNVVQTNAHVVPYTTFMYMWCYITSYMNVMYHACTPVVPGTCMYLLSHVHKLDMFVILPHICFDCLFFCPRPYSTMYTIYIRRNMFQRVKFHLSTRCLPLMIHLSLLPSHFVCMQEKTMAKTRIVEDNKQLASSRQN